MPCLFSVVPENNTRLHLLLTLKIYGAKSFIFKDYRVKSREDFAGNTVKKIRGLAGGGNGTNLRYIYKLLGYNSSKTTEIYTHVTKAYLSAITSPLEL